MFSTFQKSKNIQIRCNLLINYLCISSFSIFDRYCNKSSQYVVHLRMQTNGTVVFLLRRYYCNVRSKHNVNSEASISLSSSILLPIIQVVSVASRSYGNLKLFHRQDQHCKYVQSVHFVNFCTFIVLINTILGFNGSMINSTTRKI